MSGTPTLPAQQAGLLACPFCGDDGEKGRQTVTQMNTERTTFDRITCRCCGAMAPELNWQTRAEPHATHQTAPVAKRFMLDAHFDGMDQFAEFVLAKEHDEIVSILATGETK